MKTIKYRNLWVPLNILRAARAVDDELDHLYTAGVEVADALWAQHPGGVLPDGARLRDNPPIMVNDRAAEHPLSVFTHAVFIARIRQLEARLVGQA